MSAYETLLIFCFVLEKIQLCKILLLLLLSRSSISNCSHEKSIHITLVQGNPVIHESGITLESIPDIHKGG